MDILISARNAHQTNNIYFIYNFKNSIYLVLICQQATKEANRVKKNANRKRGVTSSDEHSSASGHHQNRHQADSDGNRLTSGSYASNRPSRSSLNAVVGGGGEPHSSFDYQHRHRQPSAVNSGNGGKNEDDSVTLTLTSMEGRSRGNNGDFVDGCGRFGARRYTCDKEQTISELWWHDLSFTITIHQPMLHTNQFAHVHITKSHGVVRFSDHH